MITRWCIRRREIMLRLNFTAQGECWRGLQRDDSRRVTPPRHMDAPLESLVGGGLLYFV